MTGEDFAAAFEAEFREWLDAAWSAYLASNPDAPPEGFRAYVRKLPDANPRFVALVQEAVMVRPQ